jgi:hypothetical protein
MEVAVCGRSNFILLFALRAIAANAADSRLAAFALDEAAKEQKEEQEQKARSMEAIMNAARP